MKLKPSAVAALAGSAVLLAACGGDKAPSKSDYIAKADKICKTEGSKVDRAAANLTPQSSAAEFAKFKSVSVPALKTELKQIRDLKMPKGDSDTLNGIYDEVEAITKRLEATPPASVAKFFNSDPFGAVNKRTRAYGFKNCGN
jgi:hypothetical protein